MRGFLRAAPALRPADSGFPLHQITQSLNEPAGHGLRRLLVEALPGLCLLVFVDRFGMIFQPSQTHGVSDDHVEDEVLLENHLGILPKEAFQNCKRLDGEMTIFGSVDLGQEMLHAKLEIPFSRGHFRQQRRAVQAIAPFELVANDQATAVLKRLPNSRKEPRRDLPKSPSALSVT